MNWIRKQVAKILPTNTIEKAVQLDIAISDAMVGGIELWSNMYMDKAPWIDGDEVKSLNVASAVASEMARLVTIEMESNITGVAKQKGQTVDNERSTYLDKQYQKVIDKLRIETEYATAKGGMIFRPYLDKNNDIAVEFVQADEFYPVEFNSSGELIAVIFPEEKIVGDSVFTRLEYHQMLDDNTCVVKNDAYIKKEGTDGLGTKTSLESVGEWSQLVDEVLLTGIERPLFAYFKMPLANNLDPKSQLGVSVYAKAVKMIEEVDSQYSKILWEYKGTELAVDVPNDMFLNADLPVGKERLFRKLDIDDSGASKNFYEVFSPTIRDASLFNGLTKFLERVEFNCGLAYGTLSDITETAKTATEIKASKQRSYATIVDIQKSLRIALEQLIVGMDYLAELYKVTPKGEYDVSFDFDDSIVVDSKEEQAIMLSEVASKLIKPEYYLQKRYGVTLEQAIEMLPDMNTQMERKDFDSLE